MPKIKRQKTIDGNTAPKNSPWAHNYGTSHRYWHQTLARWPDPLCLSRCTHVFIWCHHRRTATLPLRARVQRQNDRRCSYRSIVITRYSHKPYSNSVLGCTTHAVHISVRMCAYVIRITWHCTEWPFLKRIVCIVLLMIRYAASHAILSLPRACVMYT